MKILVDNSSDYKDVVSWYYDLERFDSGSDSDILVAGYNAARRFIKGHYTKRVYLNNELPCSLYTSRTSLEELSNFTHVYNLCPYTSEWIGEGFFAIPFPVRMKFIPKNKKKYDVIYMGSILCNEHVRIINVISRLNYIFTSLADYRGIYKPTHLNISSRDKWKLLSQSKISVCVNQAQLNPKYIDNIKSHKNWHNNQAFNDLESMSVPQFKCRVTEAMAARTLNVVKRDRWNVIETWFKPDVHFVYYDDLAVTINQVLNNYSGYQHIIDNAYKEVKKWDIDNVYKMISQ